MKKIYILYSLALILCIGLGIGLALFMIFVVGYTSGMRLFLDGIITVLPFVLPAFLSFFFVKKVILVKEKGAFIPILIWNAAVLVISMVSLSVWFATPFLIVMIIPAMILYVIPCVISSYVSALIYSKETTVQARLGSLTNMKRDIVSQIALFFIPAIIFILYDIITILALNGSTFTIFKGIQSPFILTVVFASCVYAVGVSKRTTKKFPLAEFAVNVGFSAVSTLLIFCYVCFLTFGILGKDYENSILKGNDGRLMAIIMILLPPITFVITSLITLAVRRGKKAEDSSAA